MSDARAATAAYVQALLRGSPPNGAPTEAFGPFRDLIENLVHAHAAGGTPAAGGPSMSPSSKGPCCTSRSRTARGASNGASSSSSGPPPPWLRFPPAGRPWMLAG